MSLQFGWDDVKAETNVEKHNVSFEEAQTVFRDPLAFIFDDEAHSLNERREIIVGHSANGRLLIVCYTERGDEVAHIFSSRTATRKERRDYEENTVS
jgi:uncharacterized protein